MTYPTKKLGIFIGVIILIILIIFLCPNYFNKNSGASQAAFTLALVAITGYYAWQTRRTVLEISNQTEISQMPILVLYIRDKRDYMDNNADYDQQQAVNRKFSDFLICTSAETEGSNYFFSVRNVGSGPAFNLEVSGQDILATNYQSSFIAPTKDEQKFLISKQEGVFDSLSDLNAKVIDVKCLGMKGTSYDFKYEIINIEEKKVKFIEIIH